MRWDSLMEADTTAGMLEKGESGEFCREAFGLSGCASWEDYEQKSLRKKEDISFMGQNGMYRT